MYKKIGYFFLFCLFWMCFLGSCVTVNIYFPAAKVEKTAEEIVNDVYRQQEQKQKEKTPEKQENQSTLYNFLAWLGPQKAQAQKATSVSNAAIRGLKQEIAQRHQKLLPFYKNRHIGINNNGYLAIKDTTGLDLSELATLRNLVNQDNQARKNLYREVAKALDLQSSQVTRIEEIFAEQWREKASSGWLIQKDNGTWTRK